MEQKVKELEAKIDNLTEQITKGFELMSQNFKEIENSIENLRGGSQSDLGTVESTISKGFADIILELKKINTVTRYEQKHEDSINFPYKGGDA